MTYVSFYNNGPYYLCGMEKYSTIKAKQLHDFKTLSETARLKIIAGTESRFFPKGSIVFKQEQKLNKLYCIKEGACKFSTLDKTGQEHILRFLGEGDIMGKRSIISDSGAKVSATALTDTMVCCVDKSDILENIATNSDFCNDLLSALIEDLNINEHTHVIFSVQHKIKRRLASLLLYLAAKFGQDKDGKLTIKVKREDMAAVLGTSPEYVINLLNSFKAKGYIKISKREVYILTSQGLQEIN